MELTKLPLVVRLEPPLGSRQFLMVCKQRTIGELKSEIARRMQQITTEPLVLVLDGLELMDEDEVCDLLEPRSNVHVRLLDHQLAEPASLPEPGDGCTHALADLTATISKVELGSGRPSLDPRRFIAEEVYEASAPLNLLECCSDDDASGSDYPGPGDDDATSGTGSAYGSDDDDDTNSVYYHRTEPFVMEYVAQATEAVLDADENVDYTALTANKVIAYKILEMARDMSPSVSHYRIARVLRICDSRARVHVLRDLAPAQESDTASTQKDASRRESLAHGDDDSDGHGSPEGVIDLDLKLVVALRVASLPGSLPAQ
ncbi:hypothetical protein LPJ61_000244 [Coemansia biformis]|uniref:Coilin tudor domain-containing protein n=1 Tax=Coemansia biformis TaxID=1286918 RepID=A0A9W7YK04_9FUNG|nr:hypothetical protein LPJ61_000244 [Coemansia biformis]